MRKRLLFVSIFCGLFVVGGAIAATPRGGRSGGTSAEATVKKSADSSGNSTGTVTRGGRGVVAKSGGNSGNSGTVSARAAVRGGTISAKSTKSSSASSGGKVVSARAGTKQKVVNSGTKISSATTNTVVDEECRTKYYGCMDSFCMLDNTNGGRCLCSDRNAELDLVLAEIEKLDQQSYEMATSGVEQIEMGDDAKDVMDKVNAITGNINKTDAKEARRKSLSLQSSVIDDDMFDDIFQEDEGDISNKTGDALRLAVSDMCVKSIPECSKDLSMLKMMYAQQIKSDCTAYENSLKAQKNSSAQKLATAQQALREAALEQYKNANEYDLGQCEIEFKKCMQTTAECKADFTGCVGIAAAEKAKNSKVKEYTIQGTSSNIKISLATYDNLVAKKPLCESVTKKCVKVKDQVWDAFLRDIAPTIKSAELSAESNLRMNCIADISNCFQKACKDTIDPNDPDGSYDMCLTRPETLLNLCKVQLEPCLQATGASMKDYNKSQLWDYVVARLASMRVDSCTKEVKECLQSEDRCGKDYSGCIGLDTNSIVALCAEEKLVGCQGFGDASIRTTLDRVAQGIYLNIDNNMLNQCREVLNAKLTEVCGDTSSCIAFEEDETFGSDSLSSYQKSDGSYVIDGLISFAKVKVEKLENTPDKVISEPYKIDINDYEKGINSDYSNNPDLTNRVLASIRAVQNKISQKIAMLATDPKISMCINGRDLKQIRKPAEGVEENTARFPNLLDSTVLMIVNSGIDQATKNYNKKYNEYLSKALESQSDDKKAVLCAAMAMDSSQNNDNLLQDIFSNAKESTENTNNSGYSVSQVISGAKLDGLTKVLGAGQSTFISTDSKGNMIGTITKVSSYSADTNICTLTITTTVCSGMEAIVTTTKDCASGGVDLFGGRGGCGGSGGILNIGGSNVTTKQEYQGNVCTNFEEPVTETKQIKM